MTSRIIHYFTLVEGSLDEFFIKPLLYGFSKGLNKDVQFHRSQEFSNYEKGKKNKEKVIARVKSHSIEVGLKNLGSEKLYLLVVGIDSDSVKQDIVDGLISDLNSQIPEISKNCCLIFIAVTDLETWADYLLNPTAIAGELEKRNSKLRVYPNGKSTEDNSRKLVEELKSKNCFHFEALTHLSTQSPSFSHFHQQIITYLQNIA